MQWQELRSHIRHLPAREVSRVERAFVLGKKMHEGQKRRSGEPYFNHPVAVTHMLSDLGADSETLIAALLHDTVEDTPLTIADIGHEFDGKVPMLIDGVTKLNSDDVGLSPKLDQQIETLRKIFTLMEQDVRIMVIKLVDRLHNMQTVEFLPPAKQELLAKETLEVYVKIADKLCMQDLRDELESLCLSVLEPETLSRLLEIRTQNETRSAEVLEQMQATLRNHDKALAAKNPMHFECKTWDRLRTQLEVGTSVATGLTTMTAAFVCDDVDACYRVLGALHQLWKREILSFQDFINAPQLNGYQGLHTTIIAQDGTRVRCKIRTRTMEEYAHKGIATLCFKGTSNITEILPWTKHISDLTTDTEGSSNDFWLNLKSDILGASIVIHGPDDRTVQVPHDTTVLDGAFYLFQENALRVQSIRMNGADVPFATPLVNAASLEVVLSDDETCDLEWLRIVRTGLAHAKIRAALAKHSHEKKLLIGKEMLQAMFTERKRGFIEEFDESILEKKMKAIGFASMDDVYVSIADGRLEPSEVYDVLFGTTQPPRKTRLPLSMIHYHANMDSVDAMDRLNLVHRKYGAALSEIRYHRMSEGGCSISLQGRMSPQELSEFQKDLSIAGANDITVIRQNFTLIGLIGIIILLWGLDPVIANRLLMQDALSPADLAVIRFWTFFMASGVTYALHTIFSQVRSKPLSPLKPSLIFSSIALFITALLSYVALKYIPATQYILLIIAGLVGTNILQQGISGKPSSRSVAAGIAVLGAIVSLFLHQEFNLLGVLAGIGSSLGFSVYSQLSRRYLETEARIHARYPAYVFWLSTMTILLTLGLIPFAHPVDHLTFSLSIASVAFAFFCTFLPYALYFECMRKTNADTVDRLLPFVCIVTIVGDLVVNRSVQGLFILPILALFLWLYKPQWSMVKH